MTRKTEQLIARLVEAGLSVPDAFGLVRAARTLHRWAELECGTDRGVLSRDDDDGKPYWTPITSSGPYPRYQVADRQAKALNAVRAICHRAKLDFYHQTDPRGPAIYILRPGDVPKDERAESYYTRGIAVAE